MNNVNKLYEIRDGLNYRGYPDLSPRVGASQTGVRQMPPIEIDLLIGLELFSSGGALASAGAADLSVIGTFVSGIPERFGILLAGREYNVSQSPEFFFDRVPVSISFLARRLAWRAPISSISSTLPLPSFTSDIAVPDPHIFISFDARPAGISRRDLVNNLSVSGFRIYDIVSTGTAALPASVSGSTANMITDVKEE